MGFEHILGHRELIERLGRAAQTGHVGSAYIFLGPQGVGRKQVAVAWAQALNCLEPPESFPFACGTCRSCRLIDGGQFPDLLVVESEPGKDLKIEQIRHLIKEAHYRPYEGKKRVFIIDRADAMTAGASNALLKTLEEPPETLLLILLAQSEGAMLPTIRSRCQLIRFGSLPVPVIQQSLMEHGASEAQATWLAYQTSGSLGDALAELQDGQKRQELRDEVFKGVDAMVRDPLRCFQMAERYQRDDAVPVLHLIKGLFRDLLVYKSRQSEQGVMNSDYLALISEHAERYSMRDLTERFAAIEVAERQIREIHANRQLTLERLFQELVR